MGNRSIKNSPGLFHAVDLEASARRAAKRIGLIACKLRTRHPNNAGNFALLDPDRGFAVVAGKRFDLDAHEVLDYCSKLTRADVRTFATGPRH